MSIGSHIEPSTDKNSNGHIDLTWDKIFPMVA